MVKTENTIFTPALPDRHLKLMLSCCYWPEGSNAQKGVKVPKGKTVPRTDHDLQPAAKYRKILD